MSPRSEIPGTLSIKLSRRIQGIAPPIPHGILLFASFGNRGHTKEQAIGTGIVERLLRAREMSA